MFIACIPDAEKLIFIGSSCCNASYIFNCFFYCKHKDIRIFLKEKCFISVLFLTLCVNFQKNKLYLQLFVKLIVVILYM